VENGLVLEQVMNSWDYINIILEEKGVWDTLKGWGKSAVEAGKGIVKSISGMASSVWDTVKNKVSSAFKCVAQNPMACIMEFIRAALFSPVVTGGLTALAVAVPGIGSAPDIIMYGALFIWDTYKLLSGGYETGEYAFSWGDLLLDIVGMAIPLLAGTLFKTIGNTVFKNLGDLVRWLSSKGGVISKVVNILTNQLQKILSGISSAASWLGSKLGLTVLQNFSSKATQMAKTLSSDFIKLTKPATKAISKAGTSAGQAVSNVAKKALSTKTGSALTAGAVSGGVNTAFCAAMGYDLITCKEKTESGEITPDMESEAESEARILAALRAATEAENRNT
jgi:phage-related protein